MPRRVGLFKGKRGGIEPGNASLPPWALGWPGAHGGGGLCQRSGGLEWGPEGWGDACRGRTGAVSGPLTAAPGAVPPLSPGSPVQSVLDRYLPPRWGPGGSLLPEPTVPKNLLDLSRHSSKSDGGSPRSDAAR